MTVRDDYAAEARDEHVTELDNVLYIIIALVKVKTSKYLSKTNEVWNKARGWKEKYTIPTFLLISEHSRYMVRITVIWLSVKYQNFFTFQDVKYAYPPYTVNVPFISSHIKYQGRHKNRIYQHDNFTFHVGFSLWLFFFYLKLNSILFEGNTSCNKKCPRLNWFSVGAESRCSGFSINIFK